VQTTVKINPVSPEPPGNYYYSITFNNVSSNEVNIVVEDTFTPPTPSVYNYVEFAEVNQYFAVTNDELQGFAGGTLEEKEENEALFTAYMKQNGYNGIEFDNSLTSIADGAFNLMSSVSLDQWIKAIKFSNDISIGMQAFAGCI
jgi:hypothetical protein